MNHTQPVAKRTRAKEAERIRKIHESIRKKRRVQEQSGSTSTESVSHVVLDDSDEDVVFIDDKDVVVTESVSHVVLDDSDEDVLFIDDKDVVVTESVSHVVLDDSDEDVVFIDDKDVVVTESVSDVVLDDSDEDVVFIDDKDVVVETKGKECKVGENMGLNFGGVKVENRREDSEGRKVEESSNWCDLDRDTSGLGARVEDECAESDDVPTISEDDEETESSYSEEEEPSETESDDEDFWFIETSSSDEESNSEKESPEEEGDEDEREFMIGKMKKKREIDDREDEKDEDMVVFLEKRKMNSTREIEGKKISKKKTEEERIGEKEEGADGNEKVVLLEKRKRNNKKENEVKRSREKEKEKEGGNGSTKFETANHPVFLDEVEPDANGGGVDDDYEEEEEEEDEGKEKEEEWAEEIEEKKEQEHLCGGEQKKRKQIRAFKEEEVIKILADSIWHNTELNFEEETAPVIQETTLPLKFTFGVEEKIPPKKTEEDREMDEMWADFASALYANNATNTAVRNDVVITPDIELEKPIDTATRCKRGIHNLILDHEKGLVCKFCFHVEVEIIHYVEPFAKNPYGRSSKRESDEGGKSIFSKLHHQDSTYHSQLDCDLGTHAQRTVWDIIPGIGEGMHEHQTEGFEFLWKNIGGGIDLDELKDSPGCNGGNGCIISHAPGTGKTRLAIAFIQSFIKLYPECRPVIIAPCSMLNSWEDEFRKWNYVKFPFHNLNKLELSGEEDKDAVTLLKSCKSSTYRQNSIRMVKIYSWRKSRSILAISYQLFKEFAGEANQKKKVRFSTEDDQVRKVLLELPGLLVLDEGHTPRNEASQLFKVFENVKTGKRIILSGTPFQNNFDELFNTLSLANPKFLDRIASTQLRTLPKRRRKGSEARQWWTSLTSKIDKADNDRLKAQNLEEVRRVIGQFVHVHRGDILQSKLPGLRDSVLILQPPLHQKAVIDAIQLQKKNNLNFEYWTTVVSVHPSLLPKAFPDGDSGIIDRSLLEDIKLNPDAGCKTKFVIELIRLSMLRKEKVLVFGQFISSLEMIGEQLKHHLNWIPEKDFLYMDGKLDLDRRKALIDNFNIDNEAMVMLASTKACSEGINLVGASRVVLLDVVWNPSVERQAISRAYRLGQKKIVHVYHLISSGSTEEMKYWRQAEKEKLSEMVFYSADDSRSNAQVVSDIGNNDRILEDMVRRFESMFKKIIYQPKESNLVQSFGLMDL